ncbi:MAG: hypothetical protein NUV97_00010 [archaeon]|nr:hypothetical protein [archaeon]
MFAEDNKLIVLKGFMTYSAFLEAYIPHQDKTCVLHFRIGTHGEKTPENTHPFLINKKVGMVHNGIIHKTTCDINIKRSDSWHFVEKILKPLYKISSLFWKEEVFKTLLEDYIGYSKLIFMDNISNIIIYGETKGSWNSECWFSNDSYQTRTIPQTPISNWYKKKQRCLSLTQAEKNNIQQDETNLYTSQKRTSQKSNFVLKTGEFALLTITVPCSNPDYKDETIPANTKVKIEYFGNNAHIGIVNPINNKRAFIPVWKLDPWEEILVILPEFKKGDEIIFNQNYNHFRIGDIKEIAFVTSRHVVIKDSFTLKKTHAIPKTHVTPLAPCLIETLH